VNVRQEARGTGIPLQRIVLAGFMGSGKSTVGRLLAANLGWRFADLDDAVRETHGLTVPEIFAQKGEPFFRAAETAALDHLLGDDRIVIALGGGAPETAANRHLLQNAPGTLVVHLYASFEVLYERCVRQAREPGATARPLLGEQTAARERYSRRHPLYVVTAQHTIDVTGANAEEIASRLLEHVRDQIG
jgi:shikimate kinase